MPMAPSASPMAGLGPSTEPQMPGKYYCSCAFLVQFHIIYVYSEYPGLKKILNSS